jgi:hypothetical protein
MRKWLLLVLLWGIMWPTQSAYPLVSPLIPPARDPYVLVGGQNGTWFQPGQAPRLYQIFLSDNAVKQLTPISGGGTVWTGGWNGSQWLISGWGTGLGGSDPYLYLYDGQKQILTGSVNQYGSESSWHGGDVFSVSYNGKEWLLAGMGSDILVFYNGNKPANHLALATFDGNVFRDLSNIIPEQQDGILYANAWNGKYWLVGGGYQTSGVLFTFDGTGAVDLTPRIKYAVPTFSSVQSMAWNGNYWLIGGIGFLAKYDGFTFLDLTPELATILPMRPANSVNAIAWNGITWLIGGGAPVAQPLSGSEGWLAAYGPTGFVDLTYLLPYYVSRRSFTNSSILTIRYVGDAWIVGGYSNNHALLFMFNNGSMVDRSSLVKAMSYLIWVGETVRT